MWYNYILKSTINNRTYNGSTNNIIRRIRQHNGIIKGGAKSTQNYRPYEIICLIYGFNDKIDTLQCEWRIKHPTKTKIRPNKFCKPIGRINSLNHIFNDQKFTNNSIQNISNYNLNIIIINEYKNILNNIPNNFNITYVDKIDIHYLHNLN